MITNIKIIFLTFSNIFKNLLFIIYIKFKINSAKKKIKNLKNNSKKNINVFYDLKFEPFSYGDVFETTMFLKGLSLYLNKPIKVFVVIEKFKEGVYFFNTKKDIDIKLKNIKLMQKYLLNKSNILIHYCRRKPDLNLKKNLILNDYLNSKVIYFLFISLINFIYQLINKNQKKKFILKNFKKKNIISVGVRMSYLNDKYRNNKITEVKELIKEIEKDFPNSKIYFATDHKSLKILKRVFNKKKFFYPKKKNILDDAKIILSSKKFYQYKESGISKFAQYSKIPMTIYSIKEEYGIFSKNLRADKFISNNKRYIWQTSKQAYIKI